jgi:SAM-dependent methyltransferase
MNDKYFDKLLGIKTEGLQKGYSKSFHYHRYEPTPYHALQEFFKKYPLKSTNRIVDFGCGKGRLNFYINNVFSSTVVGIEMEEGFYQKAVENREGYLKKFPGSKGQIHFRRCLAEEYPIDQRDNRFYFFNPFTIQIFMKVIHNILLSVEKSPREVELIIYYGSEDYVYFLENQTAFELKEEMLLSGKK